MSTQTVTDPNTGEMVQRKGFDFSKLKGAAAGAPAQVDIDRGAARQFWKVGGKGYTFMPQHIVDRVIEERDELVIRAVRLGTSKFGATWFTTVDYQGDTFTIPQSCNDVRNQLMYNIQSFLNEVGPLPATLEAFDTALGTGWDFAPVPDDDADALTSGEDADRGDVPF